jgi:hypothetical protein
LMRVKRVKEIKHNQGYGWSYVLYGQEKERTLSYTISKMTNNDPLHQ